MNRSFNDYQVRATETALPADNACNQIAGQFDSYDGENHREVSDLERVLRLNYSVLGLTNEAGEVAGKVKKMIRDKGGEIDDEFRAQMVAELGDVLWYLSDTCSSLGILLSDVAAQNIAKLKDRQERGKLQGDGDNR